MSLSKPVFVVAVARSGTTLTQTMLASHKDLAFPPETAFPRLYAQHKELGKVLRSKGKAAVLSTLTNDHRMQRLDIDWGALLERVGTLNPDTIDIDLYNTIAADTIEKAGKPRFGDKDPRLIENLPLVKKHWPDAKIVHIIRDPRDVLSSKMKAEWSKGRHPLAHIFANRMHLQIGRDQGPKLFGNQYVEIIYEKLLANPETELRRVCEVCELEWDPTMLQFGGAAKKLVSSEEMSWKKETFGPLLTENTGKWKGKVSDFYIALCEAACQEAFEVGGYQPSGIAKQLPLQSKIALPFYTAAMSIGGAIYPTMLNLRNGS